MCLKQLMILVMEKYSNPAQRHKNKMMEKTKEIKTYDKVKWCHTLGCNKRAVKFTDKLTDVHPNELRYVGYCQGHYSRSLTNCR